MNYEKKYNEALERAKAILCNLGEGVSSIRDIETIFPELAGIDDERIRKSIIATIKQCPEDFLNPKNRDRMLAWLEKQKEQKPDIEICPHSIKSKSYSMQKPAWSEEDETRLTNILIMLKEYAIHHYSKDDVNKSVDWLENRLKSLRPQLKAELTLLDENIIKAAVAFVEQNDHFNCWGGIEKHTVIKALRSLKPHWKPSEDHLSALLAIFNDPNNIGSQTCQLALADLYEQLLKLK